MTDVLAGQGKRSGLSLLDGLIAALLITIIALLLLPLFVHTYHVQNDAEDFITAANYARERMEELKALGYDGVPIGVSSQQVENGLFTIETEVTAHVDIAETDPPDLPRRVKKVVVRVFRNRPRQVLLTTHQTYIHKRGI